MEGDDTLGEIREKQQTFVYDAERALAYFFPDSIVASYDTMGGGGLRGMGRGGGVGSSHGMLGGSRGDELGIRKANGGSRESESRPELEERAGRVLDNSLERTLDCHQHVPT